MRTKDGGMGPDQVCGKIDVPDDMTFVKTTI